MDWIRFRIATTISKATAAQIFRCHTKLSKNPNVGVIECLLAHGVDVNARASDYDGTLLMEAASYNENPDALNVLIRAGADLELVDENNQTALQYAVDFDNVAACQALLSAGASVTWPHNRLLQEAVLQDNTRCARLLLAAGIDPNLVDSHGSTALRCMNKTHTRDVLELLISAGANVNARDNEGRTTVYRMAISNKSIELIMLVEAGADVNIPDNNGKTPIQTCFGWLSTRNSAPAVLYAAGAHVDWSRLGSLTRTHEQAQIALRGETPEFWNLESQIIHCLESSAHLIIKHFDGAIADVCISLQELQLPALILCEIILAMLEKWPRFRFCDVWDRVVLVKHFHD